MAKMISETRNTRLQGRISIASFTSGVVIACACLFAVPPYGEISNSAISIVSELLILSGALLGAKVVFDTRLSKFENSIVNRMQGYTESATEESDRP